MAYNKQQKRIYVKELQSYLFAISHFDRTVPKVTADGFYGQRTVEAVKIFQSNHNLPQTGKTDTATWNKIISVYRGYINAEPEPLRVFPKSGQIIKQGDCGIAVFVIQSMLADIHKTYCDIPCIKPCGHYTEETAQAVKEFQKLVNMKPTGAVSLGVWNMLHQFSVHC